MDNEGVLVELSLKCELKIVVRRHLEDGAEQFILDKTLSLSRKDEASAEASTDTNTSSETWPDNVVSQTKIGLRLFYLDKYFRALTDEAVETLEHEAETFCEYLLGVPDELLDKSMDRQFYVDRVQAMKTQARNGRAARIKRLQRGMKDRLDLAIKGYLQERYGLIYDSVKKLTDSYRISRKNFIKQQRSDITEEQWREGWRRAAYFVGARHPPEAFDMVFENKTTAEIARHLLGLELGYEPGTVRYYLRPSGKKGRKKGEKF